MEKNYGILPIGYWENEFTEGWKNGYKPNPQLLDFLRHYQGEIGPEILDIGSGDGRHLVLMSGMGYRLTGLELTGSGISATRCRLLDRHLDARLEQGDFHRLPFSDQQFDTVVSIQALHYNNWEGAIQSFSEASRVLKTNGLFFFRARSEKGHWRITDQKIEGQGINRLEKRGEKKFVVMVHDYTRPELDFLAMKHGLEIVGNPIDEDSDGRPGQWNVVFRKR